MTVHTFRSCDIPVVLFGKIRLAASAGAPVSRDDWERLADVLARTRPFEPFEGSSTGSTLLVAADIIFETLEAALRDNSAIEGCEVVAYLTTKLGDQHPTRSVGPRAAVRRIGRRHR